MADGSAFCELVVKIGGPEARRDMRMCLALGVDTVLAPMVESVYSLDNFVETAKELCLETKGSVLVPRGGSREPACPQLAFNLETATAWHNLDDMLFSRAAPFLHQITIGRGDLSKSLHLPVDGEQVTAMTRAVLDKARQWGIRTSVGGGISMQNIGAMGDGLAADRYNTRHMVFARTKEFLEKPGIHLEAGLRFEIKLYEALGALFPHKKSWYDKRSGILASRLRG
jgi:citrate lyase beta subunit